MIAASGAKTEWILMFHVSAGSIHATGGCGSFMAFSA